MRPDDLLAVIAITSLLSASIAIALGYRLALNEVRLSADKKVDLRLKQ